MKKNIIFLSIIISIFVFFTEILLSILWYNPYKNRINLHYKIENGYYYRLHEKNKTCLLKNVLYPSDSMSVLFRVGVNSNILGDSCNDTRKNILFFGGSTTECMYVNEKKRWPVLIGEKLNMNVYNYGVSGNNIFESYLNYVYIRNTYRLKPDLVFMMHGVNDLGAYYQSRKSDILVNKRSLLSHRKITDYQPFINRVLKKSNIICLLKNIRDNYFPRKNKQYTEFELFDEKKFTVFCNNRRKIMTDFINLLKKDSVKIVLLTQPDNYLKNKNDRQFINGFSAKEMENLKEIINQQTIEIAIENKIKLIDMKKYFSPDIAAKYLYDTHHCNEEGSIYFAQKVCEELK